MDKIQFDYYRGLQADQFSFVRVPRIILKHRIFRDLSCEAKLLYGILLDRMGLSIENHWFDKERRPYIIFRQEEVMEYLNCAKQKASKVMGELENFGLIEKIRYGLGRADRIYVKNFVIVEEDVLENDEEEAVEPLSMQKFENQTSGSLKIKPQEVRKSNFREFENQTSGSLKIEPQEVRKSNRNYTEYNYTDSNNQSIESYPENLADGRSLPAKDPMDEMEVYRSIIQENIDYDVYSSDPQTKKEVDELVELMVDVMVTPDDATIRVNGEDKPATVVKNQFMKIGYGHIEYVEWCMKKNRTKVNNIRAYLLTTLYNSVQTANHFYRSEVNHDIFGD